MVNSFLSTIVFQIHLIGKEGEPKDPEVRLQPPIVLHVKLMGWESQIKDCEPCVHMHWGTV